MTAFFARQDILNQIIHPGHLDGYGTTELHVLKAVFEIPDGTVTALVKAPEMTKGTVSKTGRKTA